MGRRASESRRHGGYGDRVKTPRSRAVGRSSPPLVADEVRLFRIATTVIAIAIADDAFVQPEPGLSRDHLASGLIPIAIALAAAVSVPAAAGGNTRV